MNTNTKLGIAFLAGVVVTSLFFNVVNTSKDVPVTETEEVSTNEEEQDTTLTDEVVAEENETTVPTETVAPTPVSNNTQPVPQYIAPSEPVVTYPYSATVSFTGSRFIPEEALIIKGGIVTFVNNSGNKKMWIASNYHPEHDAYPEVSDEDCAGSTFDQCTSVLPGGTWTFAFNEAGKWFYHEENNPAVTGQVRVITTETYDTEPFFRQ